MTVKECDWQARARGQNGLKDAGDARASFPQEEARWVRTCAAKEKGVWKTHGKIQNIQLDGELKYETGPTMRAETGMTTSDSRFFSNLFTAATALALGAKLGNDTALCHLIVGDLLEGKGEEGGGWDQESRPTENSRGV